MLAPEASELVAAVLQRSQAAVAALDAQDPERPNFEAFVQVARRALPRCAGKRERRPQLPNKTECLTRLAASHPWRPARAAAYDALEDLGVLCWEPRSAAEQAKRQRLLGSVAVGAAAPSGSAVAGAQPVDEALQRQQVEEQERQQIARAVAASLTTQAQETRKRLKTQALEDRKQHALSRAADGVQRRQKEQERRQRQLLEQARRLAAGALLVDHGRRRHHRYPAQNAA